MRDVKVPCPKCGTPSRLRWRRVIVSFDFTHPTLAGMWREDGGYSEVLEVLSEFKCVPCIDTFQTSSKRNIT